MSFPLEFQAVVLAAGKGSRMPEITAEKPKCLLPVGPKPLIWYPLIKLQDTGFTEAIVIVLENQKNEIQNCLEKHELEIKLDFVTINNNEDLGTADSLRLINDRLKSDIIVISCDFITDCNLKEAINLYRMHSASIVSLCFHPIVPNQIVDIPGPKSKYKDEKDFIGIDSQTNRLIFQASASDFEEELSLPKALFKKHTNIKIYSNLIDSHFYIIKHWIINYLVNYPNFSTIKGELLPHIVKKQLAKQSKTNLNDIKSLSIKLDNDDIFSYSKESNYKLLINETSNYNDHVGDLNNVYHDDSIRCYAFIANKNNFGIRINNLPSYWSINNKILDYFPRIYDIQKVPMIHIKCEINSNQLDDKCIVWDGAKLNEKTSFKNSLIGSNTKIHSFTRVFNSIIMNNVIIKEKVAIENCIVCDGAIIENGTKIKNCLVGSTHTVMENSEFSYEVLTKSDRLMEF